MRGSRVPVRAITSLREETAGSCHPLPQRGDTARRQLWPIVLPRVILGSLRPELGERNLRFFMIHPAWGAFVTETRLERPRNPLSGFCSRKSLQSFTVKNDDSCVFLVYLLSFCFILH